MNRIVVASDSFKGTLSSMEICGIAEKVIPEYFPGCSIFALPVADGGEGTVDCFLRLGARPVEREVTGPLSEPVKAVYAVMGDTAVIEVSSAAGLPLAGDRKDPEKTTTFGVGELIKDAVSSGLKKILLGLGGSATNDVGCGMAAALGAQFFDPRGKEFVPTGGTLSDVAKVDLSGIREFLKDTEIVAMCDVSNPLCGKNGAAYVYGPQKGADRKAVKRLDKGLENIASVMRPVHGGDISLLPGTGAAGGLGAGCIWFMGGTLKPGAEAILDAAGFDDALKGADLVITGEGRLDSQSFQGKLLSAVKRRADAAGVPIAAVAGCMKKGDEAMFGDLKAIYLTSDHEASFGELKKYAKRNYERTLRRLCEDLKGGIL